MRLGTGTIASNDTGTKILLSELITKPPIGYPHFELITLWTQIENRIQHRIIWGLVKNVEIKILDITVFQFPFWSADRSHQTVVTIKSYIGPVALVALKLFLVVIDANNLLAIFA